MELHFLQLLIIKQLIIKTKLKAIEFDLTYYPVNQIHYHLKTLINLSLVEKDAEGYYSLTLEGKKFAVRLETHSFTGTIPFQGQSAVMVAIFFGDNIESEVVLQTRLKHPYFGYKGFPTEKILFGETIVEAAKRCMQIETQLTSNNFEYCGYIHWINTMKGDVIEDKFMHIVKAFNATGTLLENAEFLKNEVGMLKDLEDKSNKYPYRNEINQLIKNKVTHLEIKKEITNF